MRRVRADIYRPDEIATVHTVATIVRKYYLLGEDLLTDINHSHRCDWIIKQIKEQAKYFAIDVLAHAVMSNHFHSVLRSRPDTVQEWDDTEVARRWMLLCPKRRDKDRGAMEPSEKELDAIRTKPDKLQEIRLRLSDISWWMRILCQRVARWANIELNETGRFFNGRFKAVRLLDDEAVVACMSYVDLNPIRAGVCQTLEESKHTSVAQRIAALKLEGPSLPPPEAGDGTSTSQPLLKQGQGSSDKETSSESNREEGEEESKPDEYLAPIEIVDVKGGEGSKPSKTKKRCSDKGATSICSMSYIQLLDATARIIKEGKTGFTPEEIPPVLERLNVNPDLWIAYATQFGRMFSLAAGSVQSMAQARTLLTHQRVFCPRFKRSS
jgi:hypothetical protein